MTQLSSSPAPTLATPRPDKHIHGASNGAQLQLATPTERHRPAELIFQGGSPDDRPGEADRALAKSLAKPSSKFESRVPAFETPGERIKWALKQRRMSASELARRLGISRAAVSLWWGKQKPASPHKWFVQVSDLLNVRVEWLVTGRGEALRTNQNTSLGPDDAGTSLDVAGARVIGVAEAEAWREGAATADAVVSARHVGEAPLARPRPFAFEVRGTSINQTIASGEYALSVDYRQVRPAGPQHGDLAVVRKRRGRNEQKIFIARLHYRDGGWELHYESHDPRWQQQEPIRLSPQLTRDVNDDGPIDIIGYVFGVFRSNPRPAANPQAQPVVGVA